MLLPSEPSNTWNHEFTEESMEEHNDRNVGKQERIENNLPLPEASPLQKTAASLSPVLQKTISTMTSSCWDARSCGIQALRMLS